jgi:membrane-bound lytic murein transglycosylase C
MQMKKTLLALGIIALLATFLPARAQEDMDAAFDEMEKAFDESIVQEEKTWDQADTLLDGQWEAQVKQAEAEWEKLRAEVEQKWDEFYYSTNKEWVDYDEDKVTRSRVNFKDGEIEISTLVPLEEKPAPTPAKTPEAPKEVPKPKVDETAEKLLSGVKPEEKKQIITQAKDKIERQVKKIFSSDNQVKKEILSDQVLDGYKQAVTTRSLAGYVTKDVSPNIKLNKEIIKSKDGLDRLKYSVKIKMVPNHLEIRAKKFKTRIKKYAAKYKLDPALVFAVIHTESYFNPLAKSRIPAFGLMQLVPRFAALEAYHYLNGEKKLLPPDYLYEPENNIKLGATYLFLLHDRYFKRYLTPPTARAFPSQPITAAPPG